MNFLCIPKQALCFLVIFFMFFAEALAEQYSVVTTIFPLTEFAQAVGGDRAKVVQLLPPGAEVHTWDPRPSDVVKLSRADVFIYIGADMEPWVSRILKAAENPGLIIIESSRGLPLLRADHDEEAAEEPPHHGHESGHGGVDPHIWLNFDYDRKIVDTIAEVLSKKDPDGSRFYRKNADAYKAKLFDLDQRYRTELERCGSKEIILGSHAAFGYLARQYGLIQIPLYGISPNAEPTPKKMAEVITRARRYKARAIYYEELVSDKLARAIAQEAGAKTLVLNPGANLTEKQIEAKITFLALMEKNLENLKYGLSCE